MGNDMRVSTQILQGPILGFSPFNIFTGVLDTLTKKLCDTKIIVHFTISGI